jgi:hypothetical protein
MFALQTHESFFPEGNTPFLSLSDVRGGGNDQGDFQPKDEQGDLWEMNLSPRLMFRDGESAGGIDVGALRHSLSEFEQNKKIESARQRRDHHIRMRVNQSIIRNQKSVDKTCKIFQKQWTEEIQRTEYSQMMKTTHEENMMLRKIQLGLIKQMCTDRTTHNDEVRHAAEAVPYEHHSTPPVMIKNIKIK